MLIVKLWFVCDFKNLGTGSQFKSFGCCMTNIANLHCSPTPKRPTKEIWAYLTE